MVADDRGEMAFYTHRHGTSLQSGLFCVILSMTPFLDAQELGYAGIGAINHSMAGAGVALPLDGSGALHWNPATIGALEHGDIQIGFGRINAPWYGDESLGNSILIPLTFLGALIWDVTFDDDDDDYKDDDSMLGYWADSWFNLSDEDKERLKHRPRKVRGMSLSVVLPPTRDRRWNLGMAIEETGSRKYKILTDSETGKPVAAQLYRVKTLEFTPTASYRISQRFFLGITSILSLTEHPGASLPNLPGYDVSSDREHCGFGLQLGVFYKTKRNFNVGFSVQSPHWTSAQNVQWINSDGSVLQRKLRYSTEQPMQYVFGISYTGFERLKPAFDVRHYDFQHLSSLYGIAGHKPLKRATSYAAGLQFVPQPDGFPIAFRVGYQFNDVSGVWEDFYYNITPPITHGHSIHYGVSFGKSDRTGLEISFSLSHSFGGGRVWTDTETGPRSFRRNPNDNTFWWSLRHKY